LKARKKEKKKEKTVSKCRHHKDDAYIPWKHIYPPPPKKPSFSLCPRMLYVRRIQIFSPSTWSISLLRGSSNGEGSTKHKPFSYTNFPQYSLQHKQVKPLELGPIYTRSQGQKTLGQLWAFLGCKLAPSY
jgi:hypothetical protein